MQLVQETFRLIYAELHAIAHSKQDTIANVVARWEKAVGRTRMALKGQPLEMMTEQFLKELQHQPVRVRQHISETVIYNTALFVLDLTIQGTRMLLT